MYEQETVLSEFPKATNSINLSSQSQISQSDLTKNVKKNMQHYT